MIRPMLRRHRTAAIAVITLIALLLTAALAELIARTVVHSRIENAAGQALGRSSDVDVDGGLSLFALFDRHFDAVTISNDHATLDRLPDVAVTARLEDVRLTGKSSGSVAHVHADVQVPAASIQDMVSASGGQIPVTAVQLDEEADTITLTFGQGGFGQATLQPRIEDGQMALHLEHAEVLGNPAPDQVTDQIRDGLADRTDAQYPLGMQATSVDVTDTGLAVTLDGGPTTLPAKGSAR